MRHMLISKMIACHAAMALATIDQSEYFRWGAGDKTGVCNRVDRTLPVTMAAGAAVTVPFQIPMGSKRLTIAMDTETAFTGSPTNINCTIGTTSGGSDVMAATDVKAQGHLAGAVAAAFASVSFAQNGPVTLFATLTAVGGTTPAGTCQVSLGYGVPAEGN